MEHDVATGGSPRRTHIAIVLDRSGSMQSIRGDVIGGFNAFLSAQQAEPGEATLTLVQFDSQDPYEVLADHVPLAGVPPLTAETFVPRGGTPLLDAVGRCILATEAWLARQPDNLRPGNVVCVIVTDGQENASAEFTLPRVRDLIQAKEALGWEFLFLSADLGAFNEAGDLGIAAHKRALFSRSATGSHESFVRTSAKLSALRRGELRDLGFDEEDRREMGRDDAN